MEWIPHVRGGDPRPDLSRTAGPMSPPLRRSSVGLLLAALSLGICLPAGAAPPTPADELLRFVPADVTFCFVLRDLREHVAALQSSPLAEHLRNSPLGPALKATPEWRQLEKANRFLEESLG